VRPDQWEFAETLAAITLFMSLVLGAGIMFDCATSYCANTVVYVLYASAFGVVASLAVIIIATIRLGKARPTELPE
jgi:uncharacterized membrane protein